MTNLVASDLIIYVTRHGPKQTALQGQADTQVKLKPEAYPLLLEHGKDLGAVLRFDPRFDSTLGRGLAVGSQWVRAQQTAALTAAGAYGFAVHDEGSLDQFMRSGNLDQIVDPDFGFAGLELDKDAFKADPLAYVRNWVNDSRSDTYGSVKVTPAMNMMLQHRGALSRLMRGLVRDKKNVGIVGTHGGVVDCGYMEILGAPDERSGIENYGGPFIEGDGFILEVNRISSGKPEGILYRNISETPTRQADAFILDFDPSKYLK